MGILMGSIAVGRHHCRLAGDNGECDCREQVHQQGVDGSHPIAYGTGYCRYVASPRLSSTVIYSPADCVTAVNLSVKDQLTLSSGVAIGSTVVSSRFLFCRSNNYVFIGSNYTLTATFSLCHSRHRYCCVDNGVPVRTTL